MTQPGPQRIARRLLPDSVAMGLLARVTAHLIEGGARWGYAARATVYLSVGAIALLAAVGLTPKAQGAVSSLKAWGAWPPGIVLLWIIGVGLYAFAGWRGLQAIFDADRLGRAPAALLERGGKAISGLVYGGLAVSIFGLLDAIEDLREVEDEATTQTAIETALAYPGGSLAVTGLGAVIALAGAGNAIRGCTSHFTETLQCGPDAGTWIGVLARVGYVARGLVMAGAGMLTVAAGLHSRAHDAKGVGGALEWLKDQPFGHAALAIIGLGLLAFAAFGFAKAGLRRIGC